VNLLLLTIKHIVLYTVTIFYTTGIKFPIIFHHQSSCVYSIAVEPIHLEEGDSYGAKVAMAAVQLKNKRRAF